MTDLSQTMAALQRIGDAVTNNDRDAYTAARSDGENLGLTDEQITDAYQWRSRQMLKSPTGHLPDFDVNGNPRSD